MTINSYFRLYKVKIASKNKDATIQNTQAQNIVKQKVASNVNILSILLPYNWIYNIPSLQFTAVYLNTIIIYSTISLVILARQSDTHTYTNHTFGYFLKIEWILIIVFKL